MAWFGRDSRWMWRRSGGRGGTLSLPTVPPFPAPAQPAQQYNLKYTKYIKCINLKYTTWSLPTIPSSSTTNTTNSQLLFSSNLDTQIQRTVRPNTNTHVHTEIQLQVQWEQDKHPTVPGTTSQQSTVQIQPTRGKSPVELFYRQKTSSPVNFSKMNCWNKY